MNELVKAIKRNDPQIEEIGMNAMTYLWKNPTCDKAKKDSNNYPIRFFLKYIINNNTPIEEAKKNGNDVTILLFFSITNAKQYWSTVVTSQQRTQTLFHIHYLAGTYIRIALNVTYLTLSIHLFPKMNAL